MLYQVLREAILRHFRETKPLIEQLTDSMVMAEPVETGRPLGEIILHMLRSIEFYMQGLTKDVWKPLPYQLSTYGTAESIQTLYTEVVAKAGDYLERFDPLTLENVIDRFNRPATKSEILLEMLEHSVQHRGQVVVYYRLLGLKPAVIPYIL
ncbi:MAG: DinB family protein [Candidatus Heimdallarchaeota archaeon]